MKRTAESRFIYVLINLVFFITPLFGSFEPLPVGGRAAGMGEAYTAIVDDIYALYYNPAGALQIQRPEIGVYYSQLYNGLTDNSDINRSFFGYGQPLGKGGRLGGIGVSYLAMELAGLYKEETIGLTYGREYQRLWNYGFSLKMLKKTVGSDVFTNNAIDPITGSATGSPDPVLAAGNSATGIGIDAGVQYRMTQAYALGLALRNINSPDLGLSDETDRVPSVLSASLARRLRRGSLGVEFTNWKGVDRNTRFALGGEHWFDNGFGLRAGGAFGSRNYSTVSFGFSYKMSSIQFDYATVLPLQGIEGTIGLQQISLTVRLGKPPADPLEQQLLREKEQRIRAETEARSAKAERDRLKKRLLELTKEQSEEDKAAERKAAAQALREAQKQAETKKQAVETKEKRSNTEKLFNAYTEALAQYNEKVRSGVSLKQKRDLLENIQSRFKDKGLDMGTVERELRSIRDAQAKAKKDFDLSMSFYQRLVQQGATKEERKSLLERIIQKYQSAGISIGSATDELKKLE